MTKKIILFTSILSIVLHCISIQATQSPNQTQSISPTNGLINHPLELTEFIYFLQEYYQQLEMTPTVMGSASATAATTSSPHTSEVSESLFNENILVDAMQQQNYKIAFLELKKIKDVHKRILYYKWFANQGHTFCCFELVHELQKLVTETNLQEVINYYYLGRIRLYMDICCHKAIQKKGQIDWNKTYTINSETLDHLKRISNYQLQQKYQSFLNTHITNPRLEAMYFINTWLTKHGRNEQLPLPSWNGKTKALLLPFDRRQTRNIAIRLFFTHYKFIREISEEAELMNIDEHD